MSAEVVTNDHGEEFRARPIQTTERGTEVSPSGTGNRVLDIAHRIAGFLDRFKLGRQEALENTQEAVERGRQFLRNTGEKAVSAAIASTEITVGLAILGGEAVGRGVARGAQAAAEGTRQAGAWLEAKNEAFQDGVDAKVDQAIDWTTGKIDTAKQTATDTVSYVKEGIVGGIDYAKQKSTEVKESVLDRVEAVKSFFREKAEAAKTRREARRERWAARITTGKEAATASLERGKEKGTEIRAKAQKRGHAAVMAARAAHLVYTANVAAK
ncbi:hypothetical protein EYC58_03230 [Candidatus Saccharibacteria bacterium]|nr:MAG: hypothetical protein EYC58_03230 [Candidatus Saccharibacteria bacterium]